MMKQTLNPRQRAGRHPNGRTRLRLRYAAILAIVPLALAACGNGADAKDTSATPAKVRIILTSAPNGSNIPLYLAKERGYYKDAGLDVTIMPGSSSQTAVTAVAGGDAEIGLISDMYAIMNAAKGVQTIAVGSRVGRHTFGILAPKDSDIHTYKDLEGKKVLAFSPQIGEELKAVMTKEGADASKVNIVMVAPTALLSTYAGGEGDALLTAIPFAATVQKSRPSRTMLFSDAGMDIPDYTYSTSPKYLKAHPETIRKFLTATYKGLVDALKDPKAGAEVFAKSVPGSSADSAELQFTAYHDFICNPAAKGKSSAYMVPETWDTAVKVLTEMKLIDKPVVAKDQYTNQFADTSKQMCPLTDNG